MNLEIVKIPVTDWEQNCRLLVDTHKREAVIIDPGGEIEKIISKLSELKLAPIAIWLTHSHLDHCGGVADLKSKYQIPLYAHEAEREFRSHIEQLLVMYGMAGAAMKNCPEPEHYIAGGQVLNFAEEAFEVLFVPGHSPGHVAFYNKNLGVLICGDTVFQRSIGRTDLPGGNSEQLMQSIHSKIAVLPPATKLLPGHGDDTTLSDELKYNPFLQ